MARSSSISLSSRSSARNPTAKSKQLKPSIAATHASGNGSINLLEKKILLAADRGGVAVLRRHCTLLNHTQPGILERIKNSTRYRSPLHLAAMRGFYKCCELLYDYGCRVNSRDIYDFTPLHLAAANGHWETVELLAERGAYLNAVNRDGETPLILAARHGHVQVVDTLLSLGADVDKLCLPGHVLVPRSEEPLLKAIQYSVQYRHTEVTRLLLEAGSRPCVEKMCGFSFNGRVNREHKWCVLVMAAKNNDVEIVRMLLDGDGFQRHYHCCHRRKPIIEAVRTGAFEVLAYLVQSFPFMVNEKDPITQCSPLHYAVVRNDIESMQLLLENGADVNEQGVVGGATPLMKAVCVDASRLLISYGADLDARDHEGRTALHIACAYYDYPQLKFLLAWGPRIIPDYKQYDFDAENYKLHLVPNYRPPPQYLFSEVYDARVGRELSNAHLQGPCSLKSLVRKSLVRAFDTTNTKGTADVCKQKLGDHIPEELAAYVLKGTQLWYSEDSVDCGMNEESDNDPQIVSFIRRTNARVEAEVRRLNMTRWMQRELVNMIAFINS
eukprot:Nk52_evm12s316 gene=Nk52_evmTU12s316